MFTSVRSRHPLVGDEVIAVPVPASGYIVDASFAVVGATTGTGAVRVISKVSNSNDGDVLLFAGLDDSNSFAWKWQDFVAIYNSKRSFYTANENDVTGPTIAVLPLVEDGLEDTSLDIYLLIEGS
jgi:hypothetical protein